MSTYRPTDRAITHEYNQPITSLAFDPVSDILWTGSSSGAVVAYCTPQAIRGVSFPVGGGQPVQKLVAGDNYVRACGLAGQGVGSWTKGGVNKWYFRSVRSAVYPSCGLTHNFVALLQRQPRFPTPLVQHGGLLWQRTLRNSSTSMNLLEMRFGAQACPELSTNSISPIPYFSQAHLMVTSEAMTSVIPQGGQTRQKILFTHTLVVFKGSKVVETMSIRLAGATGEINFSG
jgi:hypothetical protein